MVIIETGIIWRLVAKRFEERVNKLCMYRSDNGKIVSGPWEVCCVHCEHRFLGLRVIFMATLKKCCEGK